MSKPFSLILPVTMLLSYELMVHITVAAQKITVLSIHLVSILESWTLIPCF